MAQSDTDRWENTMHKGRQPGLYINVSATTVSMLGVKQNHLWRKYYILSCNYGWPAKDFDFRQLHQTVTFQQIQKVWTTQNILLEAKASFNSLAVAVFWLRVCSFYTFTPYIIQSLVCNYKVSYIQWAYCMFLSCSKTTMPRWLRGIGRNTIYQQTMWMASTS